MHCPSGSKSRRIEERYASCHDLSGKEVLKQGRTSHAPLTGLDFHDRGAAGRLHGIDAVLTVSLGCIALARVRENVAVGCFEPPAIFAPSVGIDLIGHQRPPLELSTAEKPQLGSATTKALEW